MSTPTIEEEDGNSSAASTPCIRRPQRPFRHSSSSPSHGLSNKSSTILEPDTPIFEDNGSFDNISHATGPESAAVREHNRLLASITRLREKLASSTAMLNNLRTRNEINEAEVAATDKKLKDAEKIRDEAQTEADRVVESEKLVRTVLELTLIMVLAGLVAYGVVSWYSGPEMAYIRRRRREILGV